MLETVTNERLPIPSGFALTHLQFRRFAGCPVCTLHLRAFMRRHDELTAYGVREVAVFNSSREALLNYHANVPFALVADPRRTLYRRFGLELSWAAVLSPPAWPAILKGALSGSVALPEQSLAALGLPADFLIAPDGSIAASQYGRHADDHWSVDEVVSLSNRSVKYQQQAVKS